jgi:hypothetical protein
MNTWYNNTLRDNLTSLDKAKADVDWQRRNFLGVAPNYVTLYGGSNLIASPYAKPIFEYAASKSLSFGRAYSSTSSVDQTIAWNKDRSNPVHRFTHMTTEIEPYNDGDYAGFYSKIRYAGPKLKAAGMKHICYMGWPSNPAWLEIVINCDEINLHCYRTPEQMNEAYVWDYVDDRLSAIANAAKAVKKVMPVNIIYSAEAKSLGASYEFGGEWFKSHTWWNAHQIFLKAWDKNASLMMKQWLRATNMVMFTSKYGKLIKP